MYDATKSIIIDRREQLRVKIKSLMVEAYIIRQEERRTHGQLRDELYLHRIGMVRSEARSSGLAYALIKGKTWEQVEPLVYSEPDWKRIEALVKKYGPRGDAAKAIEAFKGNHKLSKKHGPIAQSAERVGA